MFDLDKEFYDDYAIEQIRAKLKKDRRELTFMDLGAGSKSVKGSVTVSRTISQLANSSTSNRYKCRILRNLVTFFKPQSIVEFGTNLGVATAYMHAAAKSSQLTTVEGVSEIHEIAKEVFTTLGFREINAILQNFDQFISASADTIQTADLVYLDGDHQYATTLRNFKAIWGLGNRAKVIVVDDINWSEDMAKAWAEIKQIPGVNSLDVYKMGIVIRDERLTETTHIKYLPRLLKPLSFGFFG